MSYMRRTAPLVICALTLQHPANVFSAWYNQNNLIKIHTVYILYILYNAAMLCWAFRVQAVMSCQNCILFFSPCIKTVVECTSSSPFIYPSCLHSPLLPIHLFYSYLHPRTQRPLMKFRECVSDKERKWREVEEKKKAAQKTTVSFHRFLFLNLTLSSGSVKAILFFLLLSRPRRGQRERESKRHTQTHTHTQQPLQIFSALSRTTHW